MIYESIIIGLLLLNLTITLYTERKRMQITKKIAKEGQDSIKGFVQVFQSLDKKLVEAMKEQDHDMGGVPVIHLHTMPGDEEKEVPEEKVDKVAKNIETYISNLLYARDNFASPSEKKTIDNLIKNIEHQYGKSIRPNN